MKILVEYERLISFSRHKIIPLVLYQPNKIKIQIRPQNKSQDAMALLFPQNWGKVIQFSLQTAIGLVHLSSGSTF